MFDKFRGAVAARIFAAIMVFSGPAFGGTVTLFGDINSTNSISAGVSTMYDNILGTGTNVLVSKQNSSNYSGASETNYFNSKAGVTATLSSAELDSATLSGIDLLFLNLGCCTGLAVNYSASEIVAISNFIMQGGDVAIIAEPCCGTDPSATNAFLTAIGLTMQYDAVHRFGGTTTIVDGLIGAGVTSYSTNTFSAIIGGTAVALDVASGTAAVAYQQFAAVPVPAALPLLLGGLGALGWIGRRRKAHSA